MPTIRKNRGTLTHPATGAPVNQRVKSCSFFG